jgi:hypothetical protein
MVVKLALHSAWRTVRTVSKADRDGMLIRKSPTIVRDRHGSIFVDGGGHKGCVPRQRLVDTVVHDFPPK